MLPVLRRCRGMQIYIRFIKLFPLACSSSSLNVWQISNVYFTEVCMRLASASKCSYDPSQPRMRPYGYFESSQLHVLTHQLFCPSVASWLEHTQRALGSQSEFTRLRVTDLLLLKGLLPTSFVQREILIGLASNVWLFFSNWAVYMIEM